MVGFVHVVDVGAGTQVRVLGSRHPLYFLVLGHLNVVIITFHSIILFPFLIYLFIYLIISKLHPPRSYKERRCQLS